MREIKFRAWNKISKTYNWSTQKLLTLDGILVSPILTENSVIFQNAVEYILEQYTGLKDKHGKEIYEGDILNGGSYQGSLALGIVVFENGAFICKPIGRFMESFEEGYRFNRLQIIGNIHENPELSK